MTWKTFAIVCAGIVVAVLTDRPAFATNNYFFAGDGFFHTALSESNLANIEQEKNPKFIYRWPNRDEEYLYGDAGFGEMTFTGMPPTFKENLRRVYAEIRKRHPMKTIGVDKYETNPLSVFFYNASFDFRKHRLCLRYNEDWRKETMHLELFVNRADAVVEEWRDSENVKPLRAECLKVKKDPISGYGTIRVQKDVRAIVLPTNDYGRYYERKKGTKIYEVTETAANEYTADNNVWKLTRKLSPKK